ncbi:MAG: protein kinase, partial [Thermoanaerobaculales bacterium]
MTNIAAREITESFHLERVLKSSTSGIVLRAVNPATQAPVAIKLIPCGPPAHLEASQQRFLHAMGTLASLRLREFPRLLDYGFTPDASAFMVMEFIEGTRLDALPAAPLRRLLELVLGAVDGLEKLAAAEVYHGNLAPDNLFAVTTDDEERVRILGFGTTAYHAGEPSSGIELAAAREFRAPERFDSAMATAELDWRVDLYSLALTTASLIDAEVTAADGATPIVALPAAVTAELADAEALRSILERALRRDPSARPSSWDAFRQGLRHALSGAPVVEVGTKPEVTAPPEAAAPSAGGAPTESDELDLEGAPAWLAEPGPPAASPAPAGSARAMEDTNPLPAQRAATTPAVPGPGSAQPEVPPPPSGWLDDGSTQHINVAERLAMRDQVAPATSAAEAP